VEVGVARVTEEITNTFTDIIKIILNTLLFKGVNISKTLNIYVLRVY